MPQHHLARAAIGLLIVCTLTSAAAADGVDIAACMPAETAFYLGWTPSEAVNAELGQVKQVVDALMRLPADDLSPGNMERIRILTDLALALPTRSGGLGLIDISVGEAGPVAHIALVLSGNGDGTSLLQQCETVAQQMEMPILDTTLDHGGAAVALRAIPLGSMNVAWLAYKEYVIIALDDTDASRLDNVLSCIDGDADNLTDSAEFQFDRKKLGVEPRGAYFCLYADPQRIITKGKELVELLGGPLPPIVDAALEQLGIASIRSKYIHFDSDDGVLRLRAFAHIDGPMRGLMKLWDQKPLTEDDLKIIPQDAYWAEVANLDLAGLWEETRKVIGELSPDTLPAVEGAVAMSAQFTGFSITDDFLPALGDTWAFFDAPDHGGILMSGTVMAVEVQAPEAVNDMMTALVHRLAPLVMQAGATLRIKENERNGHTIHYVVIGGVPSPVSPSWGFVDGRWVFGLTPQTVAVALNEIDPATRGPRLVDRADVRAARERMPESINGFSWGDVKYINRLFYPVVNAMTTAGTSMLGQTVSDLDPAEFPTVPELVAMSHNYIAIRSTDSDGVIHASIGDAAHAQLAVAGGALATSVLLPSLSRARFVAKMAVSQSNLKGIGMACMVYANDHQDQLPESLESLVTEGFITRKMLQSPVSPDDPAPYVLIRRTRPLEDASNPPGDVLAYEIVRDDGKANVLFLDGHVETVPLERLAMLLRKTYRNIGRENEIPPEFRRTSTTAPTW